MAVRWRHSDLFQDCTRLAVIKKSDSCLVACTPRWATRVFLGHDDQVQASELLPAKNSNTGTGQIIMGRQLSVCLKIFWSSRIWQHIHGIERSKRKFNHSYLKTTVEPFVLLWGLFQQHHRVSRLPLFPFYTHNRRRRSGKYCMNLYYFSPKRLTESIFYFFLQAPLKGSHHQLNADFNTF